MDTPRRRDPEPLHHVASSPPRLDLQPRQGQVEDASGDEGAPGKASWGDGSRRVVFERHQPASLEWQDDEDEHVRGSCSSGLEWAERKAVPDGGPGRPETRRRVRPAD